MAQGVQKKTEYAGLQFLGVSAVKKLLGFEIREAPGEHARGKFRVLLSEEAPVVCERNVPVQLREEGNRAEALFCGYPQRTETMTEHGWRIAESEAVSGTVLLDMEKRSRVFQDRRQTYLGIAGAVTAETGHSACILAGDDRETGGTLIQYGETDWKFLKRMASRMGLPLVPDTGYYYPRFYMGLPEGEKKELGEVLSCGICFDGRYYAVSGRCTVDRKDFICYDVVTGTRLSLGDRVTYEGRELTVSRKKTELVRGEVLFTYRLAGESYTRVAPEENPDYTGMSFVGEVTAACGERVELAFDMDRASAGGNSYGFAPATGNLMYCMPQVGTKAALYLGSGNEAQGVVSGCIRTNGASCEGTGSPEKKGFCSEHGKGMSLYPQSMGMDGGEAGKLTMEDGSGTLLGSSGSLLLLAKEGIRLESMTGIAVHGVSDIMVLCGAGTSSLCVNGSVDMMGALTGLGGSTYRNYAPYADAPEEGKFDWGGFTRNLVMGLAVGAACIAMSLLLPGIGTIAAGALMGAGIGAVSASVAGAVGDYSSGNVRSAEEAIRDVAIAAISGAITGAIGVKFPGMNRLVEGGVDTTVATVERAAYAALDGDMTLEEKLAYIFDPGQMAVDFVTGVFIGEAVDGIAKKLPGGWKNRGGSELNNLDAQGISSKSAKGSDTFKQNGNLPNGVRTEISGSDLRHSNGFEGFDVINASSKQKGNFGEFKADDNLVNNQGLKDAGYDLKSVGRNAPSCPDDKIVKGIDGLYENLNQNSNVEYIIDEAKFGKAQLGKTDDGKQMSDDWLLGSVTGNNRILDAVDGDEELAYKIMEALKKGQVERVLSKVDADGNVVTYRLDSQGNIIGIWP